jgi:hypothetical protein
MPESRNFLVPIDFRPESEIALEYAAFFAAAGDDIAGKVPTGRNIPFTT